MLIAARNAMMVGGGFTAKSYPFMPDVSLWDGIENVGWGVHDASATIWKNLVSSSYNLSVMTGAGTFTDDSLKRTQDNITQAAEYIGNIPCKTIEVVGYTALTATRPPFFCTQFGSPGVVPNIRYAQCLDTDYVDRSTVYIGKFNNGHYRVVLDGKVTQRIAITLVYTGDTSYELSAVYINGRQVSFQIGGNAQNAAGNFCVLGRDNNPYQFGTGSEVCRLACHSRTLTAADVFANYAVDKARFNLP